MKTWRPRHKWLLKTCSDASKKRNILLCLLAPTLKLLPKSSTGEEGTSAWAVITLRFNPFKDHRAPDSWCLKLKNGSSQRKVALSLSAWHLGSVDACLAIPNSEHTHILCFPWKRWSHSFPAGTLGVSYVFRSKISSFFFFFLECSLYAFVVSTLK